MVQILNTAGRVVAERVAAAHPDIDVVRIRREEPIADSVSGDVLVARAGMRDAVAQLAGRVEWVHVMGTGIDWLPPEAFEAQTVTCARGGSAIAISEFVLATMLTYEKQLPELWSRPPEEVFGLAELGGLYGRTLGLVGIGTEIAKRALAFGMTVKAVRRHPGRGPRPVDGVEVATLDEVLGQADHLVLAAPATPETHHLVGPSTVGRLKPGVHIVNIARGTLIDQDALREALDDGRVARATLDVSTPEPLPPGHWMYTHPRVKLTGHISWSSPQGQEPLTRAFLDNLDRYLRHEPLAGVVDPPDRY